MTYTLETFLEQSKNLRCDKVERRMGEHERLERFRNLSLYAMRLLYNEAQGATVEFPIDAGKLSRITEELIELARVLFEYIPPADLMTPYPKPTMAEAQRRYRTEPPYTYPDGR